MKKAVKKLAIKKGSRSLKKGKKLKLKVQAKPGKKLASNQYYWKTSSAKKATVSAKGIVKAKQKGTVRITVYATDGSGKKASVKLQVKQSEIEILNVLDLLAIASKHGCIIKKKEAILWQTHLLVR